MCSICTAPPKRTGRNRTGVVRPPLSQPVKQLVGVHLPFGPPSQATLCLSASSRDLASAASVSCWLGEMDRASSLRISWTMCTVSRRSGQETPCSPKRRSPPASTTALPRAARARADGRVNGGPGSRNLMCAREYEKTMTSSYLGRIASPNQRRTCSWRCALFLPCRPLAEGGSAACIQLSQVPG